MTLRTLVYPAMWLVVMGTVAVEAAPVSSAFTYQGQLKSEGLPVNGEVDLRTTIFNDDIGGAELFAQQHDFVPVANGLFSVQVNAPSDVFTGDALWLEVEVRYPAGSGSWTLLTPRESIAAAPFAAFALSDANWSQSGSAVTNRNTGFVGINRNYPVGLEYFGVHAPVQAGYGGMYITTDGGSALPFYGYYTGTAAAWHYLDGGTGNWNLSISNTDRLTVTDNGRLGINNNDPAAMLEVGEGYTPSVSNLLARFAGGLGAEGTIVSDDGTILSRSSGGNTAAVLQADATPSTGGQAWSLVAHPGSSPYGGSAGSFSIYSQGENHLTIGSNGRTSLGTLSNLGQLTVGQSADNSSAGLTVLNAAEARSFRIWVDATNVARLDSGSGTGLMALNAGGGDVGIGTTDPQAQLHIGTGSDVGVSSGGYLMMGSATGLNIAVDNNEIMARNNGAVATLNLQADGGEVLISSNDPSGELRISDTVEIVSSEFGTDGAQMRLYDAAGGATFEVDAEENGGGSVALLRNSVHEITVEIDSDESDYSALRLNDNGGSERIALRSNVSSAGWISTRGSNGNYNVVLTRENANANHGWIDVNDASGNPQAGAYVNSSGNGVIWGDTKSFRVANPRDPETEIWYASLEGPEAAAYIRGTAQLEQGRAVVGLPDHFADVCSHASLTVHLTPRSSQSRGLAFIGMNEGGAVVEELDGGTGSYQFDYLIMDVRAGHEDFSVIRPKLQRANLDPQGPGQGRETALADTEGEQPVGAERSVAEGNADVGDRGNAAAVDRRLEEYERRIAALERLLAGEQNTEPTEESR